MQNPNLTLLPVSQSEAASETDLVASPPRLWLVPPRRPTSAPCHYRGHLLIVDDEIAAREDLAAFLRQRGYRVWVAATAREARAMLAHRQPDMLLLDLALPQMSGDALIRSLRRHPATAFLPIMIISARRTPRDIRDGLALGANDYLTKPIELSQVEGRINALLRHEEHQYATFTQEQWPGPEMTASMN